MHSDEAFKNQFHSDGFYLERDVIPRETVNILKHQLSVAIREEAQFRRAGIDDPLQVVCCPYYSNVFLDILSPHIFDRVDALLGRESIIYSYNNSSMPPNQGNFSSRIHRDSHLDFSPRIQSLGMIILLDDFSEDNGGTWYLPKSHLTESTPSEVDFYKQAQQLKSSAGSALYFHPHLLHAGGVNRTGNQRDALSIGFCKPNMKQRLSLPDLLGRSASAIRNPRILQKIGINSQPPKNIKEYYSRESIWYSKD